MPSSLADTVMTRLTTAYGEARDPERALAMSTYMRGLFPFLGIPAPAQRTLSRTVLAGLDAPTEADLRAVAVACWDLPEREFQYFACGYLRRHAPVCSADFLATARFLVSTKPWWDTVDSLAAHLVGPLVRRHPELSAAMDEWIADRDLWVVRSALLHQLTFKEATDERRLFAYCAARADHPDFFIRKAIGWALREYARSAPEVVRRYVAANRSRLSPLSVREATKHL
ncbi:DNA alkylation repair protein [Plantactinospora siamensis]|uniref:DNA alkylation repair protein n=1 Tax=Plantactinospora siamensis TaxID=555372 RepID=A0ABV6NZ35_9ACTN